MLIHSITMRTLRTYGLLVAPINFIVCTFPLIASVDYINRPSAAFDVARSG